MGLTEESEEMDNEENAWVCECCALMVVNGDDSGCCNYYDHTHPKYEGIAYVDMGNTREVGYFDEACDGCGESIRSYGILYAATRFDGGN